MKRIWLLIMAGIMVCFAAGAHQSEGSYFTDADGVKIYYEVQGEGSPVILVHGFTNNSQSWKKGSLYPALLKAGYQVIILDQRGNGRSDKPHTDAAYRYDAEAKDIMGLATALGLKQYAIVGYSRGSIITSRVMVLDKRVRKAVMGGMGAAYTNPQWPRRVHAYRALMGDTTLHDVDEMMAWIHKNNFDNISLMLQQKHQPSTSPAELARVKIPVLLIDGNLDQTNGDVHELQRLIPGSVYTETPGDHNSAGNTEQFANTILAFLRQ
ncbi:alpha/beta hydrolase [Mucilaginibacter sp. 44-25]|uniref:alpha/beta fold hydrolase n=1 Tax=Mucilaginibacter sp. 44-25 TaxID=1895794 RepID=UPI000965B321|nr:alpha/beta hydrolase [Mucilaginibacter sp. 44-25]OJW15299.1 MAG: hypothetical protein BGO48_14315 [Mucilaginibacter sp. 44-25]